MLKSSRTKHLIATASLGTTLAFFIGATSTWNAARGLGTRPALVYEMRSSAEEWRAFTEAELAAPSAAASIASLIAPTRKSICERAGLEEASGLLTGSPGRGALSNSLSSGCLSLGSMEDRLGVTAGRMATRREKVNELLRQLKDIPEQADVPVFKRVEAFNRTIAELDAVLSEVRNENLAPLVSGQAAQLANSISGLERAEGDLGQAQALAIDEIRRELQSARVVVDEFLASTDAGTAMARPGELRTSGEAIWRWRGRLASQLAVAVAVDTLILWLAAFLGLSRGSVSALRDELAKTRSQHSPTSGS